MKDEDKTFENEVKRPDVKDSITIENEVKFQIEDRGPNDLEQQLSNKDILISKLYQRITDVMSINDSHKLILTHQIETNKNLEKEIMKLKQEIKDIYYVR